MNVDKPMRVFSERPILFNGEMVRAILAGTKTQTRRPIDMSKLKVRLPYEVSGDLPAILGPNLIAKAGVHRATMNQHGAVSRLGKTPEDRLGLRPGEFDFVCPYADGTTRLRQIGDRKVWTIEPRASRLWVRETFLECGDGRFDYRADSMDGPARWTPSIHMPRAASRLTLEVTAVRVERLLSISESDVRAEGVKIYVTDEGCPPGKVSPAIRITGKHAPSDYMPADQASWTEADYYRGEYLALWDDIYGRTAPSKSNPWVWAIEFRRVEVSDGR
jgi:hypothetical protein